VVPIRARETQDGGRPPFEKKIKSPYLCNRLADFDEIWYGYANWPPIGDRPLKLSNFLKTKMAAVAILKNYKNRDISATVLPIFTKFGKLVQNGSLNRSDR